MSCKGIQYELPDFLGGKGSVQEQAAITDHLASCQRCRLEAERLKNVFTEIRNSESWDPSETYWITLLPRIHRRMERQPTRSVPEWTLRFALSSAAGAVLLVFIFSGIPAFKDEPQDLKAVLQQFQPDEIQDAIETQTAYGILESTTSLNENTSVFFNDKESLAELLKNEERLYLAPDLNIQSFVETLGDEEITDLVSKLKK